MKSNVRHTFIYKSVLGLNEIEDTLFLVMYVHYGREVLAYPDNQQVHPDNYHFNPLLGAIQCRASIVIHSM